jgi:hypothetical protein
MGRECGTTLNMKTRHSEAQIIQALKEHQAGAPVVKRAGLPPGFHFGVWV